MLPTQNSSWVKQCLKRQPQSCRSDPVHLTEAAAAKQFDGQPNEALAAFVAYQIKSLMHIVCVCIKVSMS